MPKIVAPKESLEGRNYDLIPAGVYQYRVDGFKPKRSNDKQSINLQPQMKIINHATLNDQNIFENLNSNAGWVQRDFCHALGLRLDGPNEENGLPGDFIGDQNADPATWRYQGPIIGKVGRCEVQHEPAKDKQGNLTGKMRANIKKYFCAIPGCQIKHGDL